jgi:hypothetical protein
MSKRLFAVFSVLMVVGMIATACGPSALLLNAPMLSVVLILPPMSLYTWLIC